MAPKTMCLQFFVLILCLIHFRYTFGAKNDAKKFIEKFAWKTIEYAFENDKEVQHEQRNYSNYQPQNNLPFSIDVWNDQLLFVSIPRYIL